MLWVVITSLIIIVTCTKTRLKNIKEKIETAAQGASKYFKLLKDEMKHENNFKIAWIMCKDIGTHSYIRIKNYLFPTKKNNQFNKKYIQIPYEFSGKKFFYLLKSKSKHHMVKHIKTEDGTDITHKILPYMGPQLDFHGATISPKDFGIKTIKVETMYDEKYSFNEEQPIILGTL